MCNFTGYSKVASLMQSHQMVPSMMISGCLGVFSMLLLSMHEKLHLVFAVSALTASSAGIAIADVTIDACVAQNSICHPSLASDMQSLCSLCSAIGALIGYSISGIFVHLIGPKVSICSTIFSKSYICPPPANLISYFLPSINKICVFPWFHPSSSIIILLLWRYFPLPC